MPPGSVPPQRPQVRIRVYGLIALTKRGYFVMLGVELVLLAVLLALVLYWLNLPQHFDPGQGLGRDWRYLFARRWQLLLPWIFGIVLLAAAIEAFIILRRFAREEKLQQVQHDEPPRG